MNSPNNEYQRRVSMMYLATLLMQKTCYGFIGVSSSR
jgi:hypothetical protein